MKNVLVCLLGAIVLVSLPMTLQAQWNSRFGPGGGPVTAVAANQSRVYATTANYLYSTTNDGQSWTRSDSSIGTVYELGASSTHAFVGTPSGLYSTTDQGHTWALSLPQYIRSNILTLSKDVFVGTLSGVYYSSNDGSTWSSSILSGDTYDLAATGNYLFANVTYSVYRSFDYGASWTQLNTQLGAYSLFADSNFIMVGGGDGGVLVSTNKGNTWTRISNGLTKLGTTQLDPVYAVQAMGQLFIAGTPHGIYTCLQGDTTWYPTDCLSDVRYLARKGADLFAASENGVWTSIDTGLTWIPVTNGFPPTSVTAIIKAGLTLISGTSTNAVFSTDDGVSWSYSFGLKGRVYSFLTAYATMFAATSTGIYFSSDEGRHWGKSDSGIPSNSLVTDLTENSAYLFAGANQKPYGYTGTVFRSSDHGLSWIVADSGLPPSSSVSMLGQKGGVVYVGMSSGGVYLSTDNGANWIASNAAIRQANSFAANGADIFVSTASSYSFSSELYRSSNNGVSWFPITLPSGIAIQALEALGNRLFVGTASDGVYLTSDRGMTWESINYGLTGSGTSVLSFAEDSMYMYIGTGDYYGYYAGGGVWYRPISELITKIGDGPVPLPNSYELEQNYPNPFNPSTVIKFQLPHRSRVTLKVFDLLGREIETLINSEESAGSHEIQWTATRFSSGIYFYRLQAGTFTDVKKMLLMK